MFHFDQLGEDIHCSLVEAEIGLALVASGTYHIGLQVKDGPTRIAHNRTITQNPEAENEQKRRRAADLAAGKPVGKFASYSDLIEMFGESNIAMLSRGQPPIDAECKEKYTRRGENAKKAGRELTPILIEIRKRFYPEFDIADFRDGPDEYVAEIKACVDRSFSPPSIGGLIEVVRKARRKIALLLGGSANAKDRKEIADYVRYVSWFLDRFDFLDAPNEPSGIENIRLTVARDYFRAVQNYLEKLPARKLTYEDILSEHLQTSSNVKHPPSHLNIEELERITPSLDTNGGEWGRNTLAAKLEGVKTRTLASYRQQGIVNADNTIGKDQDGRVWRREGTPNAHPWYLLSTLRSRQKKP